MPEIEITALEQGMFTVGPAKKFSPVTETETQNSSTAKQPTVCIRPFLIQVDGQRILLDTGLHQDDSFLIAALAKNGLALADIDIILLSHLHKDHTGGVLQFVEGQYFPSFPNAKIYIQEQELAYAIAQQDNPSYLQDQLKAISELENTQLSAELKGNITPKVYFETVGGHSPYHRAFWIKDAHQTIFYGGDNLPTRGYLKYPVAYKNDFDGKLALELRKQWEKQATVENWKVLFYHDKKTPVLPF